MTNQLEIFAKTLRRRWFQRTLIEQFFRFSKHTLIIQVTKSTDASEFDRNVSVNFLKVLVCQTFTAWCRTEFPSLHSWSFEKIRTHVIYDQVDQTFLDDLLLNYDDLFHSIYALIVLDDIIPQHNADRVVFGNMTRQSYSFRNPAAPFLVGIIQMFQAASLMSHLEEQS